MAVTRSRRCPALDWGQWLSLSDSGCPQIGCGSVFATLAGSKAGQIDGITPLGWQEAMLPGTIGLAPAIWRHTVSPRALSPPETSQAPAVGLPTPGRPLCRLLLSAARLV